MPFSANILICMKLFAGSGLLVHVWGDGGIADSADCRTLMWTVYSSRLSPYRLT
jgi:hypothetical protein